VTIASDEISISQVEDFSLCSSNDDDCASCAGHMPVADTETDGFSLTAPEESDAPPNDAEDDFGQSEPWADDPELDWIEFLASDGCRAESAVENVLPSLPHIPRWIEDIAAKIALELVPAAGPERDGPAPLVERLAGDTQLFRSAQGRTFARVPINDRL